MDTEKLLEKAKECLATDEVRFVDVFNSLLSVCGEEQLKPHHSGQMNVAVITIICIEEDTELVALLEIAVAIFEYFNLNCRLDCKIDELMGRIDKANIYKLGGMLLYDYGIANSYVNEYPHIVSLTLTNESNESERLTFDFCEGINRIDAGKYAKEYSASALASAVMWCLRGVPDEVIKDISADYFLSETAKRRLLDGESKTETVYAELRIAAKGGCFCGADAKAVFEVKDGKIISDFYTDPRRIVEADEYFEGLWNNAIINKFGVIHGDIKDAVACANDNRHPVLVDIHEIKDTEFVHELIALKNQKIIFN